MGPRDITALRVVKREKIAEIRRPMGVTILAILQLIAGLLGQCLPTIFLVGDAVVAFLGPVGTFVGVLGILAGLLIRY